MIEVFGSWVVDPYLDSSTEELVSQCLLALLPLSSYILIVHLIFLLSDSLAV